MHDQGTLAGTTPFTPGGDMTFYYWDNDTCEGTADDTSGTFGVSSLVTDGTTFTQGPLAAGGHSFKASWTGDNN